MRTVNSHISFEPSSSITEHASGLFALSDITIDLQRPIDAVSDCWVQASARKLAFDPEAVFGAGNAAEIPLHFAGSEPFRALAMYACITHSLRLCSSSIGAQTLEFPVSLAIERPTMLLQEFRKEASESSSQTRKSDFVLASEFTADETQECTDWVRQLFTQASLEYFSA